MGASTNFIVFEFVHGKDTSLTYAAVTAAPALIAAVRAELAKPLAERHLHIHGAVAKGDGGHNSPWYWHFVPDRWNLVEMSMELCDGQPSDIEADVDKWVADIGSYCPWSSRVLRERPR